MFKRYVGVAVLVMLLIGSFVGLVGFIVPAKAATSEWDFEGHTYDHSHLTGLTDAEIVDELVKENDAFLAQGLAVPQHFAYPYGEYDARVEAIVAQYRLTARTVAGIMETYPVPDWWQLKATEIKTNTAWATIQGWVDNAIASKGLLSLFTHDVRAHPGPYGMKPEMLAQLLDYLVSKQTAGELLVMPIKDAYTGYTGSIAVVVVGFDDGYYTDYTTVWPMFKARGLVGTSYIYSAAIDGGFKNNLNWYQVREMAGVPDTVAPKAPARLSARAVSSSQINLKWVANSEPDLAKYRVYRGTSSGFIPDSTNLIAETTVNSYPDTGLSAATTYYYRVTAVDNSGNESLPSAEASATTRA